MQYLLDTNMVSRFIRNEGNVANRINSLGPLDSAVTCTIVRGELLFGIVNLPQGRKRRELEQNVSKALRGIQSISIPDSAAEHYAVIRGMRRRAGRPILENDLWIAATAMAAGSVLVSHDADMQGIAGLLVEDWW